MDAAEYLDTIKAIAIERWGNRGWLRQLALAIAENQGKEYSSIHPHLSRVFKGGSCNLQGFLDLCQAIEWEIEFVEKD